MGNNPSELVLPFKCKGNYSATSNNIEVDTLAVDG